MKQYTAIYTEEAASQLRSLDLINREKLTEAVAIFEQIGIAYKNINSLGKGLYEIKPKGVRAYFKYAGNRIIIIGIVVLKKTQKAPKRYIEQAIKNIDKYTQEYKEFFNE